MSTQAIDQQSTEGITFWSSSPRDSVHMLSLEHSAIQWARRHKPEDCIKRHCHSLLARNGRPGLA